MNAVPIIEMHEAWAVEERMADGRWRVPRYANTWPRDPFRARRDEHWDDGEYRAWTFLRSLVQHGILGWLDEYEVGFEPAEHGSLFRNPKGGIFCNRNRLAYPSRGSWDRLCAAYPGAGYHDPRQRPNIGGVLPRCYPDPHAISALLNGAKAKGWFDA